MKTIIASIIIALLCGCATKPLEYRAPDSAKVRAGVIRADKSVKSARVSAGASSESVNKAIESARIETTIIADAKAAGVDVSSLESAHEDTILDLSIAQKFNTDLSGHLLQAERDIEQLRVDSTEYESKAIELASSASAERAARVQAESKLSWYRWHWWGSWIALVAGVFACAAVAFMKFTGRLAFL